MDVAGWHTDDIVDTCTKAWNSFIDETKRVTKCKLEMGWARKNLMRNGGDEYKQSIFYFIPNTKKGYPYG